MSQKSLILLGAGASSDAGMPTSNSLTTFLIERFSNHHSLTGKILNFVAGQLIAHRTQQGTSPYEPVNVEDMLSAIEMIARRNMIEAAPFIEEWHPFIEDLESTRHLSTLEGALRKFENDIRSSISHASRKSSHGQMNSGHANEITGAIGALTLRRASNSTIFAQALSEVHQVLAHRLKVEAPSSVAYISPLVKFAQQQDVKIATLNYDNCVETAGEAINVLVGTGIHTWKDEKRLEWKPGEVKLIKLHGCIDWMYANDSSQHETVVKRTEQLPWNYRPAIIFGTRNKLISRGPFLSLLREFDDALQKSEELIVIGCSLNDDHINELIVRWLSGNIGRKLTIANGPHFSASDTLIREQAIRLWNQVNLVGETASEFIKNRFH